MLLRQQSYAIKNQLGQGKILPTLYSACSSLVLYVIWIVVFDARKGSIIGALSVATPAVLCHKELARRKNTPTRGISCSSLVLYGIRIVGFHARQGPIRGGLLPMRMLDISR